MYRGTDWRDFMHCVFHDMHWGWMALSLLFGVLPQLFRAWRWRMALKPLGEQPRARVCADAIFLSYASSLVVPRIGEVARCGTLKKYDGVSFSKSLGTVLTERLVDSVMVILLTAVAVLSQLPVLLQFLRTTGMSLDQVLGRFTGTGYVVTALCAVAVLGFGYYLFKNLSFFSKSREIARNIWTGIRSLRDVKNLPLYLFYSLGIWVGYYLHFYIAFFCFDFTCGINPVAAFLIFCVGTFAVLVPTPNGAGPWHFAVKTMLILYGVAEPQAILFALVVHTIQTMEVVLLGAYGWADLALLQRNIRKT
ncbi:MAG: flippase-like domain-containing protein [Bacteroidaceae bacterium]|nr:flippase-like domain-containing protein [Bacteroidaceae bacterium]MBR6483040.1 flippase-like domain-containing protein [Bacteroidaceae bacterium]